MTTTNATAEGTPAIPADLGAMVEQDPNRPGRDRARLVGYGIPVWAIVGHLQGLDGDVAQVAHDYAIPETAVRAAIAYYEEYHAAIVARLAINAAATS